MASAGPDGPPATTPNPPQRQFLARARDLARERSGRLEAERAKLDHERAKQKVEGGRLGGWFGTTHARSNILGLTIVILSAMIFTVILGALWRNSTDLFSEIGVPLLTALTTAIGYMLGNQQRTSPGETS